MLLWSLQESPHLPVSARRTLDDAANEKIVSIVTFWELTIKLALGKLHMPETPDAVLETFERDRIATILPIRPSHLRRLRELPMHHRDPFDRLLAAQALAEELTVVSSDAAFDAYGVARVG